MTVSRDGDFTTDSACSASPDLSRYRTEACRETRRASAGEIRSDLNASILEKLPQNISRGCRFVLMRRMGFGVSRHSHPWQNRIQDLASPDFGDQGSMPVRNRGSRWRPRIPSAASPSDRRRGDSAHGLACGGPRAGSVPISAEQRPANLLPHDAAHVVLEPLVRNAHQFLADDPSASARSASSLGTKRFSGPRPGGPCPSAAEQRSSRQSASSWY